ncbi:MAG: PQQ-binding-like beta-propeller repeat protein, partial [Desulfobacterales bacterium]|nr:PQQ-binding-like beta-propeller repeat protein [Desulfobacterales bacterium]
MVKFKYLVPVVVVASLLFSFSCFAQTPGTEKWEFRSRIDSDSCPAIGPDGVIYVGSRFDDAFYAINPDGTEKWVFRMESDVGSSAAIGADGVIYFGSEDKHLYALNPDGSLKWKFSTDDFVYTPSVGPDGVIYVKVGHDFHAVNPDGTGKWSYETGWPGDSSPAIGADGVIYVGSWEDKLYAFNPDGSLKWTFDTMDNVDSSPAIDADGVIYVGSWDNNLYAINPDGSQKWAFATGDKVKSSPAIGADGVIYVGSYDGNLYAVHSDGTQKWAFETGDYVESSPAIGADGVVYVVSWNRYLYAIDPDGLQKWSFRTKSLVQSGPAIGADGVIYTGSKYLYAVYSDSPGLAQTPWPKFHRDFQNTGSAQSSLTRNESISFDFFTPGGSVDKIFEVYNPNPHGVVITGCAFTNPAFSPRTTPPIAISPGAGASLTAAITPDIAGIHQTTCQIDYEVNGATKSASMEISAGLFKEEDSELAYTAHRAVDAYTLCEAEDPLSAATGNNRGVLYRLLGETSRAEETLLNALSVGLNDLAGYAGIKMNVGVVKSDLGIPNYAKGFYALAHTDIADNQSQSALAPQIFYNNAREDYTGGDYAAALAKINNTISHAMSNTYLMAKAYILRGAIYHAQGDAGAAEADFRQALALDPDGPMGAMARGNLTPAGCTPVTADLALEMRVDLGGVKYQFTLKTAAVAADPAGLYWK